MRALVQRVSEARVRVERRVTGEIGSGLLVLVGVTHDDDPSTAEKLAEKVWRLRIMDDDAGRMDLGVAETTGAVLVVSQFTLYGDTRKGRRPSWVRAAPPEHAEPLVEALRARGAEVATGAFGARMDVELVNEGPVTLLVEVGAAGGAS